MKNKIVMIIPILIILTAGLSQSQMIINEGGEYFVTQTIDLSGRSISGYCDFSQFPGVYKVGLKMEVYGDVTGYFIVNFSVDGFQRAINICKLNNYSRFVFPDGAMVVNEYFDEPLFNINMSNVTIIGKGDNYMLELFPVPDRLKYFYRRGYFLRIPRRSESDSVFLINCNCNSSVFKLSGCNYRIDGVQVKYLQSHDSGYAFEISGSCGNYSQGSRFSDLFISDKYTKRE